MAEAMFEVVLPDYFKKFQPNFKFVITEKNPNLSILKIMLLEATSNLNIVLFQSRMKKKLISIY